MSNDLIQGIAIVSTAGSTFIENPSASELNDCIKRLENARDARLMEEATERARDRAAEREFLVG